jgi:hypothetical protein
MSLKRITLSVQSEHLAMLAALTWNSLSYDSSEYQLTTTSTRHNTEVRVSKWPEDGPCEIGAVDVGRAFTITGYRLFKPTETAEPMTMEVAVAF